ncbi:MAG: hypothetical protein HQ559_14050 [Lentisphaerae bacterium]|nr:hypothetical protein [Lentisphaerota bacterium]
MNTVHNPGLTPDSRAALSEIGEYFLAGHANADVAGPVLKYACGLRELFARAPLSIEPTHAFAPVSSYYDGAYRRPIYNGLVSEFFGEIAEQKKKAADRPEIARAIDESIAYWHEYDVRRLVRDSLDEQGRSIFAVNDHAMYQHFFSVWQGHATLDYHRILTDGLVGYATRIQAGLSGAKQGARKHEFYEAVSITMTGIQDLVRRNIAECERLLANTDDTGRTRLEPLKQAFEQMLIGAPRGVYEALQYVHFLNAIDGFDNIGRLDQYLYPFFRTDLERGSVTGGEVEAMLVELLDIWGAHGHWQVVIGGSTMDGDNAGNELTALILAARARMQRPQPSVSLRLARVSPPALLEQAFDLLGAGVGQPALYNDELYIDELKRMGVPHNDAVEFVFGGCSETHIAGKSAIRDSFVNMAKALETVFYNGRVSYEGERLGVETGDPLALAGFDCLMSAYKKQAEFVIDTFVRYRNRTQQIVAATQPALIRSIFIDDCLGKGMTHSEGGSIYNNGMVDVYGIPNVANALFAVKRLVFEKKTVTMPDLIEGLRHDFQGYDELRQLCLAQHKYGNDHEDVDLIAHEIAAHVFGYIRRHNIWNGGCYYGFCASSPGYHVLFGKTTGATPDGRRAGSPLANAIGPVQGTNTHGPTAMLNSVNRLELSTAIGTPVLNLSFGNAFFIPEHYERLAALVQTYFERGGMQMQFTVADRQTLLNAMSNPAGHANLMVRVSGYCARFIDLARDVQEEIVARTVAC